MILLLFVFVDEDIAHVEHVLQTASVLAIGAIISRVLIPDENLIFCPEQLMTAVLAHTHYLPISWKGNAHTSHVREHFGQFFQLRAFYLLSELLSPITTPFILMFYIRPRAIDFVDFFRNFTVSVVGVGDVCSFAQMDVRKHGNPDWQPTHSTIGDLTEDTTTTVCETNQYTQGEHGKTELSLVHFTLTNPEWKMPNDAKTFVNGLKKHAQQDLDRTRQPGGMNTAMAQSLYSVGSLGAEYSSIVESIIQPRNIGMSMQLSQLSPMAQGGFRTSGTDDFHRMLQQHLSEGGSTPYRSTLHNIQESDGDEANSPARAEQSRANETSFNTMCSSITGHMSRREGPMDTSHDQGLLRSLCSPSTGYEPLPIELTTADMCLSTLYLHELCHRQTRRRGTRMQESQRHLWQRPHQQPSQGHTSSASSSHGQSSSASAAAEKTPLLNPKKT